MVATGLVSVGGCVLPDQISRLRKDVADLQIQLRHLDEKQAESTEKLAEIADEFSARTEEPGRVEFADVRLGLEEIGRQQVILNEHLLDTGRRLDLLSQNVQENRELVRQFSARAGAGPPPPGITDPAAGDPTHTVMVIPTGGAVPSAEALYNSAYADFSKGNYALAISGFEEYATRYPESDLADNALYWIGECYFSQGNHRVAMEAFDRLLEDYPVSDRAAAANLKKGLSYLEQNQIRRAIVQLRFVEDSYPNTDEAKIAGDKLGSLGARNR